MGAEHLDQELKDRDPDRWLSSRFIADLQARADVVAVYAFDGELARAPKVASNALLGEIRLTWWREALDEVFEGRPVRRHPTAQALEEVVRRRGLARAPLEALIDARYRDLDPTPMSEAEAAEWARDTGGQAAVLAAGILDPTGDPIRAMAAGAVWALGKRGLAFEATAARRDAKALGAAAFPAVAHAALVIHPAASDLGKRARLTWAVLTGRI